MTYDIHKHHKKTEQLNTNKWTSQYDLEEVAEKLNELIDVFNNILKRKE